MNYYLAIDLGASSGRHIVGYFQNNKIILDEIYRFPTGMTKTKDGLIWETDRLFNEIKTGIKKTFEKYKRIESLSIDTWGVDYVLMNENNDIKPHYAYRNNRVEKRIAEVHSTIPFDELYSRTGIQFAPFNTIYQLYDDLKTGRINQATDFLMLPQYFVYLLTGIKKNEYSIATTTGLVNKDTKEYDLNIIRKLGFPTNLFKSCDKPGEFVGMLKENIVNEVGGQTKVILAPSHDTACAFESLNVPEDAAILSSGTWSLLGCKISKANTSKEALSANFTNEGGVGYIRFLKNIMGMWLPNEAQKKVHLPLDEIISMAQKSNYNEIFDANDKSLLAPLNMKEAIINLLPNVPPKHIGDLFRSIYRSLAISYKLTISELEKCLDIKIKYLYIIGGGSKNDFLNKLTKDITGIDVIAVPIEATAIGNIKTQMAATKIRH